MDKNSIETGDYPSEEERRAVIYKRKCPVLLTVYTNGYRTFTRASLHNEPRPRRDFIANCRGIFEYTFCPFLCYNFLRCDEKKSGNYENDLFKALKMEAVYIMLWNVREINENDLAGFEATTQHYIKQMDSTDLDAFRIIVMYQSENNDTDKKIYEYVTLRFGSRGWGEDE